MLSLNLETLSQIMNSIELFEKCLPKHITFNCNMNIFSNFSLRVQKKIIYIAGHSVYSYIYIYILFFSNLFY